MTDKREPSLSEMKVAYDVTREDLIAVWREHVSRPPVVGLTLHVTLTFAFLIGLWLFLWRVVVEGSGDGFFDGAPLGVVVMLGVVLIWAIMNPRFAIWWRLRTRAGRRMLGRVEITLDEEGVAGRSDVGETRLRWHAVERVVQRDERILLVLAADGAIILPRRAFASDDAYYASLAFAQAHVPGAAADAVCPQCGYNLAGGRGGCPECGWGRREAPAG